MHPLFTYVYLNYLIIENVNLSALLNTRKPVNPSEKRSYRTVGGWQICHPTDNRGDKSVIRNTT